MKSLLLLLAFSAICVAQEAAPAPAQPSQQAQPKAMAVDQWIDNFSSGSLDPAKWERFTFEGPSGGRVEIVKNELITQGLGGSRFGARTVPEFSGDRFIVETKLGSRPVARGMDVAFASVTVLFDTSGRNRLEWILRSDGRFEAWKVLDGVSEELDNHKLATKETAPTLAIARRGDEVMFLLNGEVGIQKTIKNLPLHFHVMLYGWDRSETHWESVRVVTPKQ